MRSRNTSSRLFILVGLLITTTHFVSAQQPSSSDSSSVSLSEDCRVLVFIWGAVVSPARFELRRRVRLSELIALAGGLTERAKGEVEIFHDGRIAPCKDSPPSDSNQPLTELYNLDEVVRFAEGSNPYLQAGDMVTVAHRESVSVTGSVVNPQQIDFTESLTVSQAIAMAGGTKPDSVINQVRIINGCDFGMKITRVDLKAIRKHQAEDVVLQPYDIVEVPSKTSYGGSPFCRRVPQLNFPLRVIN